MRILISSILDLKRSAPSRLHQIVRKLAVNHDVTVISPFDSWKMSRTETGAYAGNVSEKDAGFSQVYLPMPKFRPAFQEFASPVIINRIRALVQEADIHLNYNSIVTGWIVSLVSKLNGKSTVLDLADDIPSMIFESEQIPGPLRGPSKVIGEMALNSNIRMAERVFCSARTLLTRMGIPRTKYRYMPNGVDTDNFRDINAFELCLSRGPSLVYVGVLREWVDIEAILQALDSLRKEFRSAKLALAGGEGNPGALAKLLTSHGDVIEYKGFIPHSEVPEFINEGAIGIVVFRESRTSQASFPLKALEYAACGRPVISSRIPELEDSFGDSFYFADDAIEIEQCVRAIIENPLEARKRVNQAKKVIEERFEWNAIMDEYENELVGLAR